MNEDSITPDIHRLIDQRIADGIAVHVDWVARAILADRPHVEGEDAPFYRDCTFKEVSRLVKRAIGKFDAADQTPTELLLPGFDHLPRAYPIERSGQRVLVPIERCTDDELQARRDELVAMSDGCLAHARELDAFIMARNAVASAE